MRVAFDAVTLSALFHPKAEYPVAVDRVPDRLKLLVEELEAANAKIIVPTSVLSEFLVLADNDGPAYLAEIQGNDVYEIQPFDTVAAIEAARVQAKALAGGDKKSGTEQRWQVVKVDRQFIAVAKMHGVTVVYSDDKDVRKLAVQAGMTCRGVAELPAPPPPEAVTPSLVPASSNEPELPVAQSLSAAPERADRPEPDRPADPQAAQEPPQPGSSPIAGPPRSEK
ncbi:MAG: PIN domain-containing protein [Acidimicrobiia bacterium]|nr:PIN domain-containing protein [Acidimicrobiia bacterium]